MPQSRKIGKSVIFVCGASAGSGGSILSDVDIFALNQLTKNGISQVKAKMYLFNNKT